VKTALALAFVALGLAAAVAAPAAAQCVMCKTALTGSAEGRAMMRDFNHGILLMVFAPYFLMGAFVVAVFRERIVHRASRLRAAVRARLAGIPARFSVLAARAPR
jgi:hypothetical protein